MKIRTRVTASLPAALVERLDRHARARQTTRSAIMTEWLQAGARQQASAAMDADIIAYYTSSTDDETRENDAIARASLAAARSLDFDEIPARRAAKRRKSA